MSHRASLIAALWAVFIMVQATTASAADFYVTWGDDAHYDGVCEAICTFREAFEASRASTDNDVIHVLVDSVLTREGIDDDNTDGDLDLCKSVPDKEVYIAGDLHDLAWGPATQLPNRDRLIHVVDQSGSGCHPVDLIVDNLTLYGGYVLNQPVGGGAVRSDGGEVMLYFNNLFLNDVLNSTASAGAPGGGAVETVGSLTLAGTIINDNTVTNGDGGGVRALGDLELIGWNEIRDNTIMGEGNGGGIAAASPTASVLIQGTHVRDNVGAIEGGGLWSGASKVELLDTELFGNTANARGGGLYLQMPLNQGTAPVLNRSAVNENELGATGVGGGVYIFGETSGTLTVQNSTISSNVAPGQGAMYLAGTDYTLSLSHVTVSANRPVAGSLGPPYHVVAQDPGTNFSYRASILEGTCYGTGVRWSDGHNVLLDGGVCPAGGGGDWLELYGVPFGWIKPLSPVALGEPRFHDWEFLDPPDDRLPTMPIDQCFLFEDQEGKPRPTHSGCDSGAWERDDEEEE